MRVVIVLSRKIVGKVLSPPRMSQQNRVQIFSVILRLLY